MNWNDPLRPAIHEIGHVVVEYVLRGTARDCYTYKNEDGSYGGQTAALTGSQLAGQSAEEDHISLAAEFLGGWAAVNLAISGGLLPAAPTSVETSPGDFGYFGDDNDWVTKMAAIALSSFSVGRASRGRITNSIISFTASVAVIIAAALRLAVV